MVKIKKNGVARHTRQRRKRLEMHSGSEFDWGAECQTEFAREAGASLEQWGPSKDAFSNEKKKLNDLGCKERPPIRGGGGMQQSPMRHLD